MSARFAQAGSTWWGRAWLDALEGSEATDRSRLSRGRNLARKGAVHEIDLLPGHIAARVVDPTGELYDVTIAVKRLAEAEWDQVAEAIAGKAAHLAALMDGELDPGVLDDAAEVDVQLLPGASALVPDCGCPDRNEPCAHAAAAAYVAATEIDRDPFALFLLRGIHRAELLERVRRARSGAAVEPGTAGTPDAARNTSRPGTDAADRWAGRSLDDELDPAPRVRGARHAAASRHPGRHVPWDVDPAPRHGIDPRSVDELAVDAVHRAWAMLADDQPSGLSASPRADLARRASAQPERTPELAALAGVTPQRLRSWSRAWQLAGDHAVTVVADASTWCTDQDVLSLGREQLVELGVPRRSVALNYDSLGMAPSTWLVRGPDERWYRLSGATKHQDLELVAAPSPDIRDLIDPSP